ncbi:MAG: hypothetical protein PVG99_15455 [Desulfobacteraceae bacterium]|jgi:hypothetical protein
MDLRETPLDSPIEEKIVWAEDCFRQIQDSLLRDKEVAELLKNLRAAIHNSREKLAQTGILDECKDCEEREGGSCCGAGIENRYSGTLLLINLLMGASLPTRRYDPSSCFFLGDQGCQLLARHVICVNYICEKISDHIDKRKIAVLREKEGIELELLFLLNERIRKVLMNAPQA